MNAEGQLKFAQTWNRVDCAQQLFKNPEVQWHRKILEDFFFEALNRNQTEFVKLYVEQGVNVKSLLTVYKLRSLYQKTVIIIDLISGE